MVMAMLAAGGWRPVDGTMAGSHELPNLDELPTFGPDLLAGRTIKLLDACVHYELPAADWRFIWIDRDPGEQAKSLVKFISGIMGMSLGSDAGPSLAASFVADRPRVLDAYRALGPVVEVHFEDILMRPIAGACALATIAPGLDVQEAAGVVHWRSPKCLPDLDVERRLVAP
jgi:hypothetical protein